MKRLLRGICLLAVMTGCANDGARDFDLLIVGGRIIDGSGSPAIEGDIGIVGDAIAEIGDLSGRTASATVEAAGLVVAPGFIDMHSHCSRGLSDPATALQAAGIALVIAGSFSQTYLRNAFNNGFVCVACPKLVDRLKERFADRHEPTVVPGDRLDIDFALGTVTLDGDVFPFVPLGSVPQALIVAGGIEDQVRARLGLKA